MMHYTDTLMTDFSDAALQHAFRTYFGELGVNVTNWDGLFAEMSAGEDEVLVRRDESGAVVGFILFVASAVTAWRGFFQTRVGCIEEFWIAGAYRGQGHGRALLRLAEEHLVRQGCAYAILTTDTAPAFYEKNGYALQAGIQAKNGAPVYLKPLRLM